MSGALPILQKGNDMSTFSELLSGLIRQKEIKVYDLTGKLLGLPNIDRNEVAALIDRLDINETERERIRVDAGVKPIDIDNVIDNTIAIANDQTDEN